MQNKNKSENHPEVKPEVSTTPDLLELIQRMEDLKKQVMGQGDNLVKQYNELSSQIVDLESKRETIADMMKKINVPIPGAKKMGRPFLSEEEKAKRASKTPAIVPDPEKAKTLEVLRGTENNGVTIGTNDIAPIANANIQAVAA